MPSGPYLCGSYFRGGPPRPCFSVIATPPIGRTHKEQVCLGFLVCRGLVSRIRYPRASLSIPYPASGSSRSRSSSRRGLVRAPTLVFMALLASFREGGNQEPLHEICGEPCGSVLLSVEADLALSGGLRWVGRAHAAYSRRSLELTNFGAGGRRLRRRRSA